MAFQATVRVKFGDEFFDWEHIKASEMDSVRTWTGFKRPQEWLTAIHQQDLDALRAALAISRIRNGASGVKFSEVEFEYDDYDVVFVDSEGREVEPVLEVDEDGDPLLVKYEGRRPVKDEKGNFVPDPEDGAPVPVLDDSGKQQWRYIDSGEPVPTGAA